MISDTDYECAWCPPSVDSVTMPMHASMLRNDSSASVGRVPSDRCERRLFSDDRRSAANRAIYRVSPVGRPSSRLRVNLRTSSCSPA